MNGVLLVMAALAFLVAIAAGVLAFHLQPPARSVLELGDVPAFIEGGE